MRDNITTYRIWAPDNALWAQWAKPVLFVRAPFDDGKPLHYALSTWISGVEYDTALIVDLPGASSVEEGLALAQMGYRPVPLYNGVNGPNSYSMVVNVCDIVEMLYKGAEELATRPLRFDAPPAFLLDSHRMRGAGKQPGKYDNRWCVFPQDMPSAAYLWGHGIRRVIVRGDEIQNDLSHVLCRYQKQGIAIYLCNLNNQLREMSVVKPSHFRSLVYRFQTTMGLTRNAAGGFGGKVPEPTQSSGGRHYGIG